MTNLLYRFDSWLRTASPRVFVGSAFSVALLVEAILVVTILLVVR